LDIAVPAAAQAPELMRACPAAIPLSLMAAHAEVLADA
jgi:hypothetical protein